MKKTRGVEETAGEMEDTVAKHGWMYIYLYVINGVVLCMYMGICTHRYRLKQQLYKIL